MLGYTLEHPQAAAVVVVGDHYVDGAVVCRHHRVVADMAALHNAGQHYQPSMKLAVLHDPGGLIRGIIITSDLHRVPLYLPVYPR